MLAAPEKIALGYSSGAAIIAEAGEEPDVVPGDEALPLETLFDREALIVGSKGVALGNDEAKASHGEDKTPEQWDGCCNPIQERGRGRGRS